MKNSIKIILIITILGLFILTGCTDGATTVDVKSTLSIGD